MDFYEASSDTNLLQIQSCRLYTTKIDRSEISLEVMSARLGSATIRLKY